MAEKKLPEHFQFWQERGGIPDYVDLLPFKYEYESSSFRVGSAAIDIHDFDPYTFNSYQLNIRGEGIQLPEIFDHAVLLPNMGAPITTPVLYEWTHKNPNQLPGATAVMKEVFASFLSNPDELPLQDEDGFGFMGFNAHLQENEGLRLQVFGNCACMGPEWPGDLIHGVENEFAEYHLHNADTQAQRVSLYAGLGHLASLAAQRTD
jgi:hypothetical protein